MQSVLIVVHLMIIVALVALVLLQRSEGGALGLGGGGFLTGRGQANALTRATAILAGLFFATSLGLSILARLSLGPEVISQTVTPIEPETGGAEKPGENKGSLLDRLKRMEGEPAQPPALPPGVSVPAESSMPAESEEEEAPEETHSIVQIAPPAKGPNLPAAKQPLTPLSEVPAQAGARAAAPLLPESKPLPYRTERPASEPWAK
jgi:preprotein translocase subunit SecG